MVVRLAPLGIALPMLFFQKWSGPTSLSLYFSTPSCSLARCAQYSVVVVPATPNDGPFPQP